MRKILLLLLLLLFFVPAVVWAQGPTEPTFESVAKKYAQRPGYTVVGITEDMLRMKGLARVEGVRELRVVTADQSTKEFTDDMLALVGDNREGYKLLSSTVENQQSVLFYYKPVLGRDVQRVGELLMLQHGRAQNMMMLMRGDFSIQQIKSIAGGMVDIKM